MERKFLEDLGLDKEAVDKIMAQHGKDIEGHKSAAEAAARDKDTYKEQLGTLSERLKAFDGVDVTELQKQVKNLQDDLTAAEKKYQDELAEMTFNDVLKDAITTAKGKNAKAIMALLDMDTLKASKNQKEDVAAALKALAESDAYLFGELETTTTTTTPATVKTGGEHHDDNNNTSSDPFVAAAMKGAGLTTGKEG